MPYRDQLIRDRRKQGNTLASIGREFNITRERVRQILQSTLKQNRTSPSQPLLTKIRQADDLNHLWDRAALLDAIGCPDALRLLLDRHFYPVSKKVSVRQMMDWCLPKITNDSNILCDWLPAYRIHRFGNCRYAHLIGHIDGIDFGAAFRREWRKRRTALIKKFPGIGM
jgi:hypothetical protein